MTWDVGREERAQRIQEGCMEEAAFKLLQEGTFSCREKEEHSSRVENRDKSSNP